MLTRPFPKRSWKRLKTWAATRFISSEQPRCAIFVVRAKNRVCRFTEVAGPHDRCVIEIGAVVHRIKNVRRDDDQMTSAACDERSREMLSLRLESFVRRA